MLEVSRKDRYQVERQPGGLHQGQTFGHVGSQQPVGIGLVMDQVPHPDECVVARQRGQPLGRSAGCSSGR